MRKVKFFASLTALMTLSVAALTACTTAEASTHHTVSQTGGESVHSSRLDAILERGYIEVATEPSFAPNEFIDTTKTGQDRYAGSDIQLANYIATLVNGGTHYSAHLLKSVKSYDYSEVLYEREPEVLDTIEIAPENLNAVLEGMRLVAAEGGTTYRFFKDLPVTVGAKTGSAQVSSTTESNAVFVCFAPYEDPEIALAVVVEKGGSGMELAAIAADVLEYYFSTGTGLEAAAKENTLLR